MMSRREQVASGSIDDEREDMALRGHGMAKCG
jgi:hypothetical protein